MAPMMTMELARTLLTLACGLLVWPDALPAQSEPTYAVVVNAANPTSTLTPRQLSDIFLKKAGWPQHQAALPIDRRPTDPLRVLFTKEVHRKPIAAVVSYWHSQIFSGRGVPPADRASDADVLAAVRAHPGAVGYVSADALPAEGVKVLKVAAP